MTQRILIGLVFCLLSLTAGAQEKVTLTTPVFTDAGASDFRVWSLYLKRAHPDSPAEIRAVYRETTGTPGVFVANGKSLTCLYADGNGETTAETLIVALNKANLSSSCAQAPNCSLERRLLKRCQDDGKIPAGAITGSPQD